MKCLLKIPYAISTRSNQTEFKYSKIKLTHNAKTMQCNQTINKSKPGDKSPNINAEI